jgi:DNA polymerase-1
MVRCWARLREERMQTRLVLQIHDELLFEGPPEEMDAALELVRTEMTTAYQLDPPLEVDAGVGTDWLNAK